MSEQVEFGYIYIYSREFLTFCVVDSARFSVTLAASSLGEMDPGSKIFPRLLFGDMKVSGNLPFRTEIHPV